MRSLRATVKTLKVLPHLWKNPRPGQLAGPVQAPSQRHPHQLPHYHLKIHPYPRSLRRAIPSPLAEAAVVVEAVDVEVVDASKPSPRPSPLLP